MAPKKLTDCPENLRQAIDWLIQVRYGNGDKNGLDELSGALKKLIEEAIEKAVISMIDEIRKLLDPWKAKPCCEKKFKAIKEVKERIKQGTFIENIHHDNNFKLLNYHNDLCNIHHSIDSSKDDALKKLNEKLEQLENLSKDLNDFTKNKTILDDLCTGLEKFLGYQSGNYTGEGIVYGDCDRLRDAVLMFLHGVLEGVKKQNDVATYRTIAEPTIGEIIRSIKSSVGGGPGKFGERIKEVGGWLRKYEIEVEKKTAGVSNALNDIYSYINQTIPVLTGEFSAIDQAVQRFLTLANDNLAKLKDTGDVISKIDIELQKKLKSSIDLVAQAVESMAMTFEVDHLRKVVKEVEYRFKSLPGEIKKYNDDNVSGMIRNHKNEVDILKSNVKNEIECLRNVFLMSRVKVAKDDLEKAVTTFRKNALNLGGMRNRVVAKAIDNIQDKLKTETDKVLDNDTLEKLRTGLINQELEKINNEINQQGIKVKRALEEGLQRIEAPEMFFLKRESYLRGLVTNIQRDLNNALACAINNAKNLGGLNNKSVAEAMRQIEEKSKVINSEVKKIDTFDNLKALSHFIEVQIGSIGDAINKEGMASPVRGEVDVLRKTIESPESIFTNKHNSSLMLLVTSTQDALERFIAKAQDCIQTHGGVNNLVVKNVIEDIQRKLDIEMDGITTMTALKNLKTPYMDEQIRSITKNLNGDAASNVKRSLEGQTASIKAPEKIFNDTHKSSLGILAGKVETDLKSAIDNAIKYVESSQGSLQRKIVDAFDGVSKLFNGGNTKKTELESRMQEELDNLIKVSDTFDSGIKVSLESSLKELNGNKIVAVKSMLKAQEPKNVTQDELNSWFISTNSYLFTYVFKEANEKIIKSDQEYQTAVKAQLQQIKSKIVSLPKRAESDELGNAISLDTEFAHIMRAVNTKSVYGEYKQSRTKYFENLMQLINGTVDTLKTAYQKAYQSSAKSYLSGAIDKIQKEVERGEATYKSEALEQIQQIEGMVRELKNEAEKDKLKSFLTSLTHFDRIQSNIITKSVFSGDVLERQKYFENLKDVIFNTVKTLQSAYQKAYQSSAKAYLSGAIKDIKAAVEVAEAKYEKGVATHVVKFQFDRLTPDKFTKSSDRDGLIKMLTQPFEALLPTVVNNSVFEKDAESRRHCFEQLKSLIVNTVQNLSTAYKEAYSCSAKSFLNNAIDTIRKAVEMAERTSKKDVETAIHKIKNTLNLIEDSTFKSRGQSKKKTLNDMFETPFEELNSALQDTSAFKSDLLHRQTCFSKLQDLITRTVDTLADVTSKFDTCAERAQEYLGQSFNDSERGTQTLGRNLNNEVQNAFDVMIAEVQAMYAMHKTIELDTLKKCVEWHKAEIDEIIKTDKERGLKGFLNKIHKQFIPIIESIKTIGITSSTTKSGSKHNSHLRQAAEKLNEGFSGFFVEWGNQYDFEILFSKASDASHALHTLLEGLQKTGHFNYEFSINLETLNSALNRFTPETFGEPSSAILQILKESMVAMAMQLGKAYVSTYSGELPNDRNTSNYADILLSITSMLYERLHMLFFQCSKDWSQRKVDGSETDEQSKKYLANYIKKRGFEIENLNVYRTGEQVAALLTTAFQTFNEFKNSSDSRKLSRDAYFNRAITSQGPVSSLYNHLRAYYTVCHYKISSSPKVPCSIFEMLTWLSGLEHRVVKSKLKSHCATLFDGEKDLDLVSNMANLWTFQLPSLFTYSLRLLLQVLGHGDEFTIYAVNFSNNYLNLKYPDSGEDCLHMLFDIVRRLFPQLRFLQHQCRLSSKHQGWANCRYGKDVKHYNWPCDEHSRNESNCQQKSPLMSYLSDCLPGLIPHELSSIGCKFVCMTCPISKPGMTCITPLGFKGFSCTARMGSQLSEIIEKFFYYADIRSLMCLVAKPPSTLSEHFSFALSLVRGLEVSGQKKIDDIITFHEAFDKSIHGQSLSLHDNSSDLITALCEAYRSRKRHDGRDHPKAIEADLSSLATTNSCMYPNIDVFCGPYLSSLCHDYYYYLANKHSTVYLSWSVYLPWQLWNHLKSLYDAFCNISCQHWGCSRCLYVDECRPGQHGIGFNCKCHALVRCRGVMSTFYSYGFTFGNPTKLLDIDERRYCRDFCSQLANVLNSEYFKTLFEKCDTFLWTIRKYFFHTTVALWLLSLLYLLHIMVIRLDLLHIKSHLHSPSSHRIAAQSLLAAARVNKLGRVFYLQP